MGVGAVHEEVDLLMLTMKARARIEVKCDACGRKAKPFVVETGSPFAIRDGLADYALAARKAGWVSDWTAGLALNRSKWKCPACARKEGERCT